MTHYEFATLQARTSAAPDATLRLADYLASRANRGCLLGCWISEIGALNRIALLRSYTERDDHDAERHALVTSVDPFGCGGLLADISLDTCTPFPNLPPIEPGAYGPFYEIRTYTMEVGGLAPTLENWAEAIPKRAQLSKLVTVMHTTGAAPRMVSIWPYTSIGERQKIRAKAIAEGIWPPKDSARYLQTEMLSTIYLPTEFSPLQ